MSKTIALLTDFGLEDNYVGIMKGVILGINPDVRLVDISHATRPQDILEGALTLKSAYVYFPEGTIFVAVVDPGVGTKRKPIILKTKNYVFVAPDNGLLSFIFKENPQAKAYAITNQRYFLKPISNTFHGRDVFAPVAAYISRGESASRFGVRRRQIVTLDWPSIKVDHKAKTITGEVIGIDRFGNLITNIDANSVKRKCVIKVKDKNIGALRDSYADVRKGKFLAVIGSKGYLEISVNQGSAQLKLKAHRGDSVKVVFTN